MSGFSARPAKARNYRHGHAATSKRKASAEYRAYYAMIARCYNPRATRYSHYGGRPENPITVCDRWRFGEDGKCGFLCFLEDVGKRPSKRHSLHRVLNDKGYFPENCIWATRRVQQSNKSNTRLLTYKGRTLTLTQWSTRLRVPDQTLRTRLNNGWSVERTLTPPLRWVPIRWEAA
jgi:hypothetical protein